MTDVEALIQGTAATQRRPIAAECEMTTTTTGVGPTGPGRQTDIQAYADAQVAKAPPLTPQQRARLTELFRSPQRNGGG